MICEWWIGKDMKEMVIVYFKVLAYHFPGGTEENYRETSVGIADLCVEIWNQVLLNPKWEC